MEEKDKQQKVDLGKTQWNGQSKVLQSGVTNLDQSLPVSASQNRDSISFTSGGASEFIARISIRTRYLSLIVAIILGLLAAWIARDFKLDRSLESMFPKQSKILLDYQLLKSSFGGNEVILLVYSDDQFWMEGSESLPNLKLLSSQIAVIPGVLAVMDLSQVDQLVRMSEGGLSNLLTIMPLGEKKSEDSQGIRGTSPLAIAMKKQFEGYTHSATAPWISIAVMLDTNKPEVSSRSVLVELKEIARKHFTQTKEYYFVGEPVLVEEGFDLIEQDGIRLGWISAIALSIFLILVIRTVRWTIATLAVVYWSLYMTRAICVVASWQLTMVSSMLVAMVTVIGIATCMHWFVSYQRRRYAGEYPEMALRDSLEELFKPILWACLTTAIAFVALMAANVEPIKDYGLMMAVATISVLIGILLIVPGIVLLGASTLEFKPSNFYGNFERVISRSLSRFLEGVLARPQWTSMILVTWCLFTILGTNRVEVETDFLKNFRSDSSLVQGYRIVEEHLGGAGVWDVVLPAPRIISQEYLAEVTSLCEKIRSLSNHGMTKVISLAGAEEAARESPILRRLPLSLRLSGMRTAIPVFYDSLITDSMIVNDLIPRSRSSNERFLRIMLRAKENVNADAKQALIREVSEVVSLHTSRDSWKNSFSESLKDSEQKRLNADEGNSWHIVTGYYVLLSSLVQSVVADQWVCFALAALAIGAALRFAIGSWKLAAITLVPNALPSLGILATMGLLGIKMNLGAALISAVSLGLSVDSSIHYLTQYRRRRSEGMAVKASLLESQSRVGVPLVVSTIVLLIGFGSLTASEFVPTIVFGATASICMLLGLIGNLWWLPMLVASVETQE